ncbi:hypothetical protein Zmor_002770 [Zophobas morio]|uniref:Uncharacterized protein n=1 Tax=Zophobas morio TaxID=2755281 RepID=A0AA38HLM1_9CUCU|nr:hypothetical protein Zmor_002770 [Zophobas morio]
MDERVDCTPGARPHSAMRTETTGSPRPMRSALIKLSMIVYCERMRVGLVHVQRRKLAVAELARVALHDFAGERPVARSTNTGHILKGHRVPLLEGPRPPPSRASSLWERRFTTPPNTETNATRSEITGLGHMENKVISRGYGFITPVGTGTAQDDLRYEHLKVDIDGQHDTASQTIRLTKTWTAGTSRKGLNSSGLSRMG